MKSICYTLKNFHQTFVILLCIYRSRNVVLSNVLYMDMFQSADYKYEQTRTAEEIVKPFRRIKSTKTPHVYTHACNSIIWRLQPSNSNFREEVL